MQILLLLISYNAVVIAGSIIKEDQGYENTEVTKSSFEFNSGIFQLNEDRSPLGDEVENIAIISSDHYHKPRDEVDQKFRRVVTGLHTKCIPKVKYFCKKFTVRGITKRFCLKRKVFVCTALDQIGRLKYGWRFKIRDINRELWG